MKTKDEVKSIITQIACDKSPVGMDAVYVHALILDKLMAIERRLDRLEASQGIPFDPDATVKASA